MKKKLALAALAASFAGSSFAADPTTIAELTTGISFSVVATGILAVAAAIVPVLVTKRGASMVLRFIGR